MISLGDAAPFLKELHPRMCASEVHTSDLPAAYVRLIYGLPEGAPVSSRVNQLAEHNCFERSPR
jgi:hypothetical protein